MPLDRRRFLALSSAASAAGPRLFAQAAEPSAVAVTLHTEKPGPAVPANFIGLSYETQQLANPDVFSSANASLIAQFRRLSPQGVLRLGGNTSDVGWWKPTPTSTQPPLPPNVVIVTPKPNEQPFQKLAFPVTPQAVINLRGFLDATGWTCIYGINLGTSTPARAAAEAEFVAHTLGARLEYFQIGNEPDLFPNRFRDRATWNADKYFDEWLAVAQAIENRVQFASGSPEPKTPYSTSSARVPLARFCLPDTAGRPDWYATVVTRLLALTPRTCPCEVDPQAACSCTVATNAPPLRPRIAALSHHYYFSGPPSNPKANVPDLLRHDPRVDKLADDIRSAARHLDKGQSDLLGSLRQGWQPTPYRMSEGNTCYQGGKPGVSDVFAAALWAADYALTLASFGYCGLNLHGGGGRSVADSLGGTLPGEFLMPDPKAPHPRPFYTPIAQFERDFVAEPVFYGLLFAQQLTGGRMLSLDFDPGPVNAAAYAALLPTGQVAVAVINKDALQPLHIDLPGYSLARKLSAPSLDSRTARWEEPDTFREVSIVAPATAVILQSAH